MSGAGERLRDVARTQEPTFRLRRLTETVRVRVHGAGLLSRPRRQQRDLIDHVLHFVAEGRLGRRRRRVSSTALMLFAVAVFPHLRHTLKFLTLIAGLALVARLDDAERAPRLLVRPVALTLVRQQRRLAGEGQTAFLAHKTDFQVGFADRRVARFRERVGQLQGGHTGLRVACGHLLEYRSGQWQERWPGTGV